MSVDRDLFGAPVLAPGCAEPSRRKRREVAKGFAAPPGTGPDGETCGSCRHSYTVQWSKRYWKCALVKPTRGRGSDIRVRAPACKRWEAKL